MASTTITDTLLTELKRQIFECVSYARYKIGSTWYRTEIESKEIRANGAVHVTFYLTPTSNLNTPASQFRLYDANGTLLAERTENVAFASSLKVQYRFKFGVSQGA